MFLIVLDNFDPIFVLDKNGPILSIPFPRSKEVVPFTAVSVATHKSEFDTLLSVNSFLPEIYCQLSLDTD